jgi:hypothetical protein
MEPTEIYTPMLQHRGSAYRESQTVSWSHYDDPIDHSPGRPAGNSRVWGDASPEAQSRVIDTLIASSERAGLNSRETAYVLATARVESGFNLDAAAGTTSATGLGQFIDKTGASYGIDDGNRSDLRMQADALVAHYQENAALAKTRGHGEEYIYKYHHDGPSGEYGGLDIAKKEVMPYLDKYERFVHEHEQKYGIAQPGPSLAHSVPHQGSEHHAHTGHAHGVLEEGAKGQQVRDLQTKLAKLGYLDSKQSDADFGLDTRHAVERFQNDHGLTVDGKVGKDTNGALDTALKTQAQDKVQGPDKGQTTPSLADPKNPDHKLYQQAYDAVARLDAQMGRKPDQHTEQLAGGLTVAAKEARLSRIDHVLLSDDRSRAFAVSGALDSPDRQFTFTDTAKAVNTPLAESAKAAALVQPPQPEPQGQTQVQNQTGAQNQAQSTKAEPSMVA